MGGSSGGGSSGGSSGGGMSSLGGQIGSSLGSAGSSWVNYQKLKKANVALENSQNNANALYTAQYGQTQQDYSPWITGGRSAFDTLLNLYGIGTKGFTDSPEYAQAQSDFTAQQSTQGGNTGAGGGGQSQNRTDYLHNGPIGSLSNLGGSLKNLFGGSDSGAGYNPSTSSGGIFENSQQYQNALNKYHQRGGGGGADYSAFQNSPDYQFALQQGQKNQDTNAANRGGLFSGEQLKATQQYGQGLATQNLNNYLNRLTGIAGQGMGAQNVLTQYRGNYSNQLGQGYTNLGDIRAAKQLGIAQINQNNVNKQNDIWGGGGGTNSGGSNAFNPYGQQGQSPYSYGGYSGSGSNNFGGSNYTGAGSSNYNFGQNMQNGYGSAWNWSTAGGHG